MLVGIYRDAQHSVGCLRWCEIDFVHPQYERKTTGGTTTFEGLITGSRLVVSTKTALFLEVPKRQTEEPLF